MDHLLFVQFLCAICDITSDTPSNCEDTFFLFSFNFIFQIKLILLTLYAEFIAFIIFDTSFSAVVPFCLKPIIYKLCFSKILASSFSVIISFF